MRRSYGCSAMLVSDQLGTSIRARPRTGPLKFIRVSKKGRLVVCRSRLVAILRDPFRAYTYKAGGAVCQCPPAQPQFRVVWLMAVPGGAEGQRRAGPGRVRSAYSGARPRSDRVRVR